MSSLPKPYLSSDEIPLETRQRVVAAVQRDIDAVCNIYRSVGTAMYDEPRQRLAERIASRLLLGEYDG